MNRRLAGVAFLLAGCGGEAAPDAQSTPDGAQEDAIVADGDIADGDVPDSAVVTDGPIDVDGETSPGTGALLDPLVSCAPSGDKCAATADTRTFVDFRRDFFLPSAKYDEPNPDPVNGGRFQIAGVAKVSGAITSVTFDGVAAGTMLVEPKLEWFHVWPRTLKAGEPIWVTFHSRDPKWSTGGSAQLVVKTDAGEALAVKVQAKPSTLRLTYVTTNSARDELLIHVRNEGDAPRTLSKLIVDGHDVTAVACVAEPTIPAKTSVLFSVPLCTAQPLGAAWTAVVEAADGVTAVGAGRVLRPFHPIETWANSSDCPFPAGGKLDNFDKHRAAGIDTYFMYVGGGGDGCAYDTLKIISEVAPARSDLWPFVSDGFVGSPGWETALKDTSRLSGFLLGDEVDGEVYVDGKSKAESDMLASEKLWNAYPEAPTYVGSKTNRNVGAFAGVTDVQGSDFYVAACAPHITAFGTHPPIDGAYDYLKNTRDNHMPLPTWLYAQGLSPAWNKKAVIGGAEIVSQPDPQEILVQGFSAMAAGAKGLMWFQTNMKEASRVPARWEAIAYVSWTTRVVRDLLRTGDLVGTAKTTGAAIVDAVRTRDAIVVPVISTKTSSGPTDLGCQLALGGGGAIPHWQMAKQTLDVSVDVPRDLGVLEVLEVEGKTVKVVSGVTVSGRTVTIKGVSFDDAKPARVFVLAANADVQKRLTAAGTL